MLLPILRGQEYITERVSKLAAEQPEVVARLNETYNRWKMLLPWREGVK